MDSRVAKLEKELRDMAASIEDALYVDDQDLAHEILTNALDEYHGNNMIAGVRTADLYKGVDRS